MNVCMTIVTLYFTGISTAAPKTVEYPSGETLEVVKGAEGKDEEFYDPFSSGNLLVDVNGSNGSKQLSKNFKASEFAKSGNKRFTKIRLDPELVRCVQNIRDKVARPVVITSGYRSFKYNNEVYKQRDQTPTKSRHLSGQAVDIKITGMSGLDIAKAAIDAYGKDIGVGIGADYAHIDVRGKWSRWTYFEGDKNLTTIQAIDKYRNSK